eukprot:6509309-Pyramimonas_sp.AAC.1
MKQPRAGRPFSQASSGNPGGHVSHMAVHRLLRCESAPRLPSDSLRGGRAVPTLDGLRQAVRT